jgi:TonB family protein
MYKANGLPPAEPDSMLLKLEDSMTASLERGDFAAAGRDAEMLLPVFYESSSRASSRILKERQPVLIFKPRKSACVPGARPAGEQRRPKLYRAESLEGFYPPEALERGEAGDVVMRAKVDARGCATAVAIAVHSGVEALDTAALSWFETAQFAPASDNGRAQDGEFLFKVKFVIQDRTQRPQ